MSGTLNPYRPFYTGAPVPQVFWDRWRSRKFVGAGKPWMEVLVRRGYMHHRKHSDWPGASGPVWTRTANPPPFGRIVGRNIHDQWFPDWTPVDDWTPLDGIYQIDLDQSFDKNGITVATVTVDNDAWVNTDHGLGQYHVRQRGFLWPWRGNTPAHRPGSGQQKNEWFNRLPNAQILIRQGWGQDAAVKTFTGLIDSIGPGTIRPDRTTLTCRDFGSILVDSHVFGWNKDKRINDPITFVPHNYHKLELLKSGKTHRWILIKDATDIVRCALRWSGFKEWEIEDCGVGLHLPFTVDKSKTWADVITEVQAQLGYVFYMAEPTSDDLSIGVPVFRRASVLVPRRAQPVAMVTGQDLLTDIQPQRDNTNEKFIIRVRGTIAGRKKGGRPIVQGDNTEDGQLRYTFTYWPPWMPNMSGVIKQLTYYNVGAKGTVGFTSTQDCMVAAVLIASQIALGRDTATIQIPGNPGFGLDAHAYVSDESSGVSSRLYVTNRKSTMMLGGNGTSSSSGSGSSMLWTTELGGSLVDSPEWDHIVSDYQKAIHGGKVQSSGGTGQWS